MFGLNDSQSHTELKRIRLAGLLIIDPHTDALKGNSSSILNPRLCLHVSSHLPKAKQVSRAAQKLDAVRGPLGKCVFEGHVVIHTHRHLTSFCTRSHTHCQTNACQAGTVPACAIHSLSQDMSEPGLKSQDKADVKRGILT